MSRIAPAWFAAALLFGTAACHHVKPVAVAPTPAPNADSLAAANARSAALARRQGPAPSGKA